MKKIFLKTLIGSLIISAILAILVILFGFDSDWGIQTLFTTLVIFPFSITGLCCSSISENEKVKWFSYIGIATNIIGCLMYIGLIWGLLDICLIFCEEDTNLTWNLLGTVVSPLLHKATKKQEQKIAKEEPINKEIQITQLKCPNCNFEIKEDWKFCPNCNTNLKEK